MANDIWKPSNPIVNWFDGHPVLAAIVALFLPGIPQILMGHFLVGGIFLVGACVAWPFLMGWLVAIIAAIHAHSVTPREPKEE